MATARLMETWAHGLDVADALGVKRPATARLRSIAHIGVRTRDFAFAINGLAAAAEPFRVELRAPDGSTWSWGPEDAAQRVTGLGGGLLHAGHPAAAASGAGRVTAEGADAQQWLTIAQAFAGPPGRAADRTLTVASVTTICTPLDRWCGGGHGRSRRED